MSFNKKKETRKWATATVYVIWNIWKEQNRRVFQRVSATPNVVVELAREEFNLFELAISE